jgi:hypothetical protein
MGNYPVGGFYRFAGVYIYFFEGQPQAASLKRQVESAGNIWKHSRQQGPGTFDLGWWP